MTYRLPDNCSLGLKFVHPDGSPMYSDPPEGFKWNLELGGETEAPDWDPEPEFGGGLHLWAWAQGDPDAAPRFETAGAVWLVVEYETDVAVDLGGCVKVPKCKTICVETDPRVAADFIRLHTPHDKVGLTLDRVGLTLFSKVVVGDYQIVEVGGASRVEGGRGATVISGVRGISLVGEGGVAVAGDMGVAWVSTPGASFCVKGIAITGDWGESYTGPGGKALSGERGEATAGCFGLAEVGNYGKAIVRGKGTAKAGDGGRATAGALGTVQVGDWGHGRVGTKGTVCGGYKSTLRVGINGVAKAGAWSRILFRQKHPTTHKRRWVSFKVGEGGCLPDTFYKLKAGKLEVVTLPNMGRYLYLTGEFR